MIGGAITIDIGPELAKLLTPIITAAAAGLTVYFGQRKTRKELKPNGGQSMRDAVDRTEEAVKELAGTAHDLLGRVESLEGQGLEAVDRRRRPDSPLPPP